MNTFKTRLKDFFFQSKDIMAVVFFTLLGLVGFILYLSFFTTAMLWVALAYLTFTLFKSSPDEESEGQVYAYHFSSPHSVDDFRVRLSQV